MKLYRTTVECKGCKAHLDVKFEARPHFDPVLLPLECTNCKSELSVQVKRGIFNRQLLVKVNMLSASKKLIRMLTGEPPKDEHDAKDHE